MWSVEVDWCHSLLLRGILVQESWPSDPTSWELIQWYLPLSTHSVILEGHPAGSHARTVERIHCTSGHNAIGCIICRIWAFLQTCHLLLSDEPLSNCFHAWSLWNRSTFGALSPFQRFLRLRIVVSDIHFIFATLSRMDAADLWEKVADIKYLTSVYNWAACLPCPLVFLTRNSFLEWVVYSNYVVGITAHFLRYDCAFELYLDSLPFLV